MATLAGIAVAAQWRYAYLFGILPALLILWVRARVREPERWQAKAAEAKHSATERTQLGSFRSFGDESAVESPCGCSAWRSRLSDWERFGLSWSPGRI